MHKELPFLTLLAGSFISSLQEHGRAYIWDQLNSIPPGPSPKSYTKWYWQSNIPRSQQEQHWFCREESQKSHSAHTGNKQTGWHELIRFPLGQFSFSYFTNTWPAHLFWGLMLLVHFAGFQVLGHGWKTLHHGCCPGYCIQKDFKGLCRTSLVAQWLRIRLPMQGTRVRALVQEDPTCHRETKPVGHNY